MNYELAASTLLLATHCAFCGRALRDAPSVERGVGPDCAERHGYGNAEGPAWWPEAQRLAAAAGLADAEVEALGDTDPRHAANVLCHRVALRRKADPHAALSLACAIRALGFTRMGDILIERLAERAAATTIRIETRPTGYRVMAENLGDRFDAFVAATRAVPGRCYDRETKANIIPRASRAALWDALRASVPGAVLVSERGTTVV
jgi:hypothetical protein